ncbi:MAG TPA: dienelactone hydrolase family protein [Aggregatilineales bacterium]|nr:dienelactone hydrolase family protein [Aggregatilineales bacterium]
MHGRIERQVTSGYINIMSGDQRQFPAFWAHPEAGGTFPGLVLVHEWWGLTSFIRGLVRRLAEMGFYVIAPDLYNGGLPKSSPQAYAMWQGLGESKDQPIDEALRALETHNRFNGKIGLVGLQAGGELVYNAVLTRTDLDCAVVFYARPDAFLEQLRQVTVPLLAFYGYADTSADLRTLILLRDALANAPAHGEVVIFQGATTGFFNDELPAFHPKAAAEAWGKMLDFLTKRLTIERSDATPSGLTTV